MSDLATGVTIDMLGSFQYTYDEAAYKAIQNLHSLSELRELTATIGIAVSTNTTTTTDLAAALMDPVQWSRVAARAVGDCAVLGALTSPSFQTKGASGWGYTINITPKPGVVGTYAYTALMVVDSDTFSRSATGEFTLTETQGTVRVVPCASMRIHVDYTGTATGGARSGDQQKDFAALSDVMRAGAVAPSQLKEALALTYTVAVARIKKP